MKQLRLYVTIACPQEAEQIYDLLEKEFESEDIPISCNEINEASTLFEISVYIPEKQAVQTKQRFTNLIEDRDLRIETEILPDIDWVAHSLSTLPPVRVKRFFIHGSHHSTKTLPNDLAIQIEAGQAFGTGHHETTVGCLEMIDWIVKQKQPHNVLDIGTGSAILAIAAAKLSRLHVLATDIDPIAVKTACENIRFNGVSQYVTTIIASGLHHLEIIKRAPFDLIIANILAIPLMQMAPGISLLRKPQAPIILSGILKSQRQQVLAAYRLQGIYHQKTIQDKNWVTLHLQ